MEIVKFVISVIYCIVTGIIGFPFAVIGFVVTTIIDTIRGYYKQGRKAVRSLERYAAKNLVRITTECDLPMSENFNLEIEKAGLKVKKPFAIGFRA